MVRLIEKKPLVAAGFGGALVRAWVEDFESVRPWFRYDPRSEKDWQTLFERLAAAHYPRTELRSALQARSAPLHELQLKNLEAIKASNTYVVITGQQPGLFGGPLYCVYKALSAIRYADWLQQRYPEFRFVPLFWIASDDHDLAEIDHTYFLNREDTVQRFKAATDPGALGQCVGAIEPLPFDTQAQLDLVKALGAESCSMLAPLYAGGTFASGFQKLMERWLGPLGLLFVDSRDLRGLGSGLYACELNTYRTTNEVIRQAGSALQQAGFMPGFQNIPDRPKLFGEFDRYRLRLEPVADGFRLEGSGAKTHGNENGPLEVWRERIVQRPHDFSPAAALRPVLQNAVIPVAATILGPGEMAYWAQLGAVHDFHRSLWPMVIPRASLTLLDAAAEKALRKLEIAPGFIQDDPEKIKRELLASPAQAQLQAGSDKLLQIFDELHHLVNAHERGFESAFDKARKRIAEELQRLEAKVQQGQMQRHEAQLRRFTHLRQLIRPLDRVQERTLCSAQFLSERPTLPAELLALLEPLQFEHLLVTVDD